LYRIKRQFTTMITRSNSWSKIIADIMHLYYSFRACSHKTKTQT
jgi:hypothetical protein